jgi:hypothetical protein
MFLIVTTPVGMDKGSSECGTANNVLCSCRLTFGAGVVMAYYLARLEVGEE